CARVGDVAAEARSSSRSWYGDFTTRCALPTPALVMIRSWNELLGFVAPYTRSSARLRYSDRRNPLHDLALKLVVLTSSATSGSAPSKSTRADSNHSHRHSSTLHLRQSRSWFLDVNRDITKLSSSSQASVVVVVELVLRPAAPLLSSVKLVSSNGDFPVFCKPGP
ncbi:unnamed protein product, partial [Brassica rapa]